MYGDTGNDVLLGNADDDFLYGGEGEDKLDGGAGNDYLSGDNGNDTLIGGLGNDSLFGGLGDDQLNGGAGNDYFLGGQGNETIYGGAGSDIFAFGKNAAEDKIMDFSIADHDMIQIYSDTGITNFTQLKKLMVMDNGGVEIGLGSGGKVLIVGATIDSLTSEQFIFSL